MAASGSSGAPMTASRPTTGTTAPSWATMRRRTPLALASTSALILSVSIVATGSPFSTASPSRFSQAMTFASVMVMPSWGILIAVAIV